MVMVSVVIAATVVCIAAVAEVVELAKVAKVEVAKQNDEKNGNGKWNVVWCNVLFFNVRRQFGKVLLYELRYAAQTSSLS
jgi:hypothetical protein